MSGLDILEELYMEENEDVTVLDLLNNTTETEILKAYKPQENE